MSEVSAAEWKTLLNDFGTFLLTDLAVIKLKENLKECYDAISECKGNRESLMKVTEQEFGHFSAHVPNPGYTDGEEFVLILYKVPGADVVCKGNEWSLQHGSETQLVITWLREYTGKPLKTIFKRDVSKPDPDDKKGLFNWPVFRGNETDEPMKMYFQLDFSK